MILPGTPVVDKDMQDQIFRAQVVQALNAIGGQLDLLIQLECGFLPRKQMKGWFTEVNKPKDEDKATVAEAYAGGAPHDEAPEANLLDDEMRAKIEGAAQGWVEADRVDEEMALD